MLQRHALCAEKYLVFLARLLGISAVLMKIIDVITSGLLLIFPKFLDNISKISG